MNSDKKTDDFNQKATPKMKLVRASEASRRSARSIPNWGASSDDLQEEIQGAQTRITEYRQRLRELGQEKKQAEFELQPYSSASMAKRQAEIREQYAHDENESYQRWMNVRKKMKETKRPLAKRVAGLDAQIAHYKSLIRRQEDKIKKLERLQHERNLAKEIDRATGHSKSLESLIRREIGLRLDAQDKLLQEIVEKLCEIDRKI